MCKYIYTVYYNIYIYVGQSPHMSESKKWIVTTILGNINHFRLSLLFHHGLSSHLKLHVCPTGWWFSPVKKLAYKPHENQSLTRVISANICHKPELSHFF